MTILRVALDVPLPQLFDYRADEAGADDIGCRVLVPFGRKHVVGVIVEVGQSSNIDPARLRKASAILRDTPPLPGAWLELARFCAGYYQRPLGEVILNALPPRLRRGESLVIGPQTFALAEQGHAALDTLPVRQKVKRLVLQRLQRGPAAQQELQQLAASAGKAIMELRAAGWIESVEATAVPQRPDFSQAHVLNDEQQAVIGQIGESLDRFGVFLLHGVTGSGKTEIYLQVIARVLAAGRQALVLVPEINLTPQLEETFRRRFQGVMLVTLHSGLAETERAQHWLAALSGRAGIVLGTRLAVFAPLAAPGIIVADEEQDSSFKQQDGVRYSARDLAVFRAQQSAIPIVLGSATPSLESYARALSGRYRLLTLTRRAHEEAELPQVRIVDLREHAPADGLAPLLTAAIETRLARQEQSLVFLNRRGYAPVLACPSCGWVSGCKRCSARLVVHLAERMLRCHHCGDAARIPRACPQCGNVDLQPFGRGTQRLEAALTARFPQARILRVDRDSTRAKGRWSGMRETIRDGQADILVGTQILAKGHDFPRVTLVGVLNADAALFAADYRASERLFAQLVQVAGRAGRADLPGEVLIQTRYPRHPLYLALAQHDYAGFARALLSEREQAGFPPYVSEAVLRAESTSEEEALDFLKRARRLAPQAQGVTVFDPVPMLLARLAGRERAQLLVQSGSRPALQKFLSRWNESLAAERAPRVRWHLDVDPIEF